MKSAACLLFVLVAACATDLPPDMPDAAVDPDDAAVVVVDDAGTDAATVQDVGPCPTYSGEVQAIYQRHCATCHTSGRDPLFGTSYSVAAQTTSACGRTISIASCTVQLGRPGGSMARNDRLGGFAPDELATLQAWIACGVPQ